jgi:hypothetical protein
MADYNTVKTDLRALGEVQQSFCILEPLLAKKDDVANTLADVWNALLDARACIINKILDSNVMGAASLECDLKDILQRRALRQ